MQKINMKSVLTIGTIPKFNDKNSLKIHMTQTHTENSEAVIMKCIVCEQSAGSEAELAKHYELKHINKDNVQCNKCKENSQKRNSWTVI